MIHVLLDGIVYSLQKFGGINTYFNEVLPRLARCQDTRVEVLVPHQCVAPLPGRPAVRLRREPLAGLLAPWEKAASAQKIAHYSTRAAMELRAWWRKPCVFHSTYFTYVNAPVAQVATIYDLNHERFPEKYDSPWGRWIRQSYRDYVQRATRVIAISAQTKQDAIAYYQLPEDRLTVIPLAVAPATFFPDRSLETRGELTAQFGIDRSYLLYVGQRSDLYKNFGVVLEALAAGRLSREVLLVVAGGPWSQEERARIGQLHLEDSVRLVTHPSDVVLRNLYSSALAFVYPSLFEGFGVPLLEALACHTLVIAADTPVFREVAGPAALYFDPHSPASLGDAIALAVQPEVRGRHVALGTEWVKQYSWDRCARETHAVYRQAVQAAYG